MVIAESTPYRLASLIAEARAFSPALHPHPLNARIFDIETKIYNIAIKNIYCQLRATRKNTFELDIFEYILAFILICLPIYLVARAHGTAQHSNVQYHTEEIPMKCQNLMGLDVSVLCKMVKCCDLNAISFHM